MDCGFDAMNFQSLSITPFLYIFKKVSVRNKIIIPQLILYLSDNMANPGLVLFVASIVCVSLATAAPRSVAMAAVKPVNVTLYYESLCPDCQEFIMGQLGPTWEKVKLTNLMTVDLLPYGNSRVNSLKKYRSTVSTPLTNLPM